ncbi:MAG: hypothetical protein ACQER0_03775 [Bacillota bacterium]
MKQVYSLIPNFYDAKQQFDYQKTKKLVEHNLKNGQNKFYLKTAAYNFLKLNYKQQQKFYFQLLNLMPANADVLIETDFSSLATIQTIIEELNLFPKQFKLVIRLSSLDKINLKSNLEAYLLDLAYLNKNCRSDFYINLDSRLLNLIDSQKLIEKSLAFNNLQGFLIDPVSFYDLDLKKFKLLKGKYKNQFEFLVLADDFYYLNLDLGVKTISKYFNLLPSFFKDLALKFSNNSLELAKKQQLALNEFMQFVQNLGETEAFKYLLAKILDFEPISSLSETEKLNLEAEFNKINEYIVDKV